MRTWVLVVKSICFVGLAALLLLIIVLGLNSTRTGNGAVFLLALVPALFMALLVWGHKIDYVFQRRRFKRSPFYGGETLVTVADSGVTIRTPKSNTSVAWAGFNTASRLPDGFLIVSDPNYYLWWPDKSLTEGSAADVDLLLQKHLGGRPGPAHEPT